VIINPYRFAAGVTSVPEPKHWWDLDNLTTGLDDKTAVTATAADMTAAAGVSITTDGFATGQDCVTLDGSTTSYLNTGATAWQSGWGNVMSGACWAYMDSVSSAGNFFVDWNSSGDQNMQMFYFNTTTDYLAHAVVGTGGSVSSDDGADTQPSTGAWFHMAFTWDGSTFKSFLDGVEVQSKASAVPTAISTAARGIWLGRLGTTNNNTYKHIGDIAMVGIWSDDIGQSGVDHLYNSSNGRLYADLTIV